MSVTRALGFMKALGIALYRRSLYTAGIVATILILVVLYYALMPGSWFLQAGGVVVNTAEAGKDVPFDWCREPRHGSIYADARRTFYRLNEATKKFETAGEYRFNFTIEDVPTGCATLRVAADRQPQQEGVYYFVTDLSWYQNGWEKDYQFASNQYTLLATPDSLRQRIRELEGEVQSLKDRLAVADPVPVISAQPLPEDLAESSPVPSAPITSTTTPPSTSGGADPPQGQQPSSPSILGGVREVVNGLTNLIGL